MKIKIKKSAVYHSINDTLIGFKFLLKCDGADNQRFPIGIPFTFWYIEFTKKNPWLKEIRTNEIYESAGATIIRGLLRGSYGYGCIKRISTCKHSHPAGYNAGHTSYFMTYSKRKNILKEFCKTVNILTNYDLHIKESEV